MKSRLFTTLAASAFAVGSAQAAILVSSGSWNRLYSDTGTMLKSYTETDANYQGNTVDLAGNVYFADYGFGIKKYNGTTGAFIGNTTDNSFYGAGWPLFGITAKTGTDLMASYNLGANAHFVGLNTSATNTQVSISPAYGPSYEGLNYSQEVGVLYATTSNGGGLLQYFDATGNYMNGVAVGTAPKGVVRDDFNDMHYIADFGGTVWRWNGVNAPSVFISGLTNAYGVTAVGDGDIWVSDFGTGNLNRYNSSGLLQSSFNVGANATYITYTTIPEPGAALLGGMGLLALLRRRRA
jgi:hypothetical protein